MHPKKPKGLSMGLGYQFFEYLDFEFGFEYFAISNKIIQNAKNIKF